MTPQAIQHPRDIYKEVCIQMTNRTTAIAKNLRRRSTEAEKLLWNHLRAKQMHGLRFRRQEPIGRYIVDFLCYEVRMVIEVDGGQHCAAKARDNERDDWLKNQGFNVLRFWDNAVLTNIEGVLEVIRKITSPSPNPSHQGRGVSRAGSHHGRENRKNDLRSTDGSWEERSIE